MTPLTCAVTPYQERFQLGKETIGVSISGEVRKDIKAARKIWLPWRVLLILGVFCLATILICDHFGRLSMALPLYNCIGVFGFVIYLKWDFKHQPWFWMVISMLAALHAVSIWYIPWTSKWVPALGIAVISSADFCLILCIVAAARSMTGGETTAER